MRNRTGEDVNRTIAAYLNRAMDQIVAELDGHIDAETRDRKVSEHYGKTADDVRGLLAQGGDLNAIRPRQPDDENDRPLHALHDLALSCEVPGSVDLAEMLLDGGVNPEIMAEDNSTPLEFICSANLDTPEANAFARLLLDHGADPNHQVLDPADKYRPDNESSAVRLPPLSRAAFWPLTDRVGIVRVLLDAGADPNLKTVKGYAPAVFAVHKGKPETLRALVEAGADLTEGDLRKLKTMGSEEEKAKVRKILDEWVPRPAA